MKRSGCHCCSLFATASLWIVLLAFLAPNADAYVSVPRAKSNVAFRAAAAILKSGSTGKASIALCANRYNDDGNDDGNDDDDDDEIFTPTRNSRSKNDSADDGNDTSYLDDLTPPPVNFARNSILFSENPSTKARNNAPLEAWRFCRTYLPAVVTGAWPWREIGDDRPLAALYNMVVVRLPVVLVACTYLYQKLVEGHDLVLDFGLDASGPQPMPPVLVLGVLVLILL